MVLFCLGHICIHLASAGPAYYIRLKTPKVYSYIFNQVIDKSSRIELTKFEQPDFYDRFARALDECLTKAMDGLHSLTWAVGCGLTVLFNYLYVTVVLKTSVTAKIGLYVATLSSIDYFSWRVKETIKNFIEAGKNCMYMNNLPDFLEMDEETVERGHCPVNGTLGDISVEHVSFTYTGAKEPVIRDLSLHIRKGERIALVGENGAGKITFVKLLMRLYDVTQGKICYGGHDIRSYTTKEYRDVIGAVFQDYQIYGATLEENVIIH